LKGTEELGKIEKTTLKVFGWALAVELLISLSLVESLAAVVSS
jgi:hypothetical protein